MLYETAKKAWKEQVQQLAVAIDSDYFCNTGQHLELEVARDLAMALIVQSLKKGCYLEIDLNTKMVNEKPIFNTEIMEQIK